MLCLVRTPSAFRHVAVVLLPALYPLLPMPPAMRAWMALAFGSAYWFAPLCPSFAISFHTLVCFAVGAGLGELLDRLLRWRYARLQLARRGEKGAAAQGCLETSAPVLHSDASARDAEVVPARGQGAVTACDELRA